jgi:hypothetical protein
MLCLHSGHGLLNRTRPDVRPRAPLLSGARPVSPEGACHATIASGAVAAA